MPASNAYIKCKHCGTLFGIENEDGTVLHIKFKDLYREVIGRVSGPCRKCGSQVVWPTGAFTVTVTPVITEGMLHGNKNS